MIYQYTDLYGCLLYVYFGKYSGKFKPKQLSVNFLSCSSLILVDSINSITVNLRQKPISICNELTPSFFSYHMFPYNRFKYMKTGSSLFGLTFCLCHPYLIKNKTFRLGPLRPAMFLQNFCTLYNFLIHRTFLSPCNTPFPFVIWFFPLRFSCRSVVTTPFTVIFLS